MSVYFNIMESNLKIPIDKGNDIVKEIKKKLKEQEIEDTNIEKENNLSKILKYVGLPFTINEEDLTYDIGTGTSIYEIWGFKEIMQSIAIYLDKDKRFEMLLNYFEYGEKEKFVFKNGNLQILEEEKNLKKRCKLWEK